MAKKEDETLGAALAAYTISVNLLGYLRERHVLCEDDLEAILRGIINSLETPEALGDPAARTARVLIAGIAEEFRLPGRLLH